MLASPGNHSFPWSVTKAATATDSYLIAPSSIRTPIIGVTIPTIGLRTEKSEGTVADEDTGDEQSNGLYREGNTVRYHFYGNDDAFALWGDNSLLTSDIDLHANINFEYAWQSDPKKVSMKAVGKITGDQFPAVETYVLDRIGNGVMLGVWQVNEGDGPVFLRNGDYGIIGDKKLPMIDIDVSIIVENGLFTGVQSFGRIISLSEHNKRFTDLSPVRPGSLIKRGFLPNLYPSPVLMP